MASLLYSLSSVWPRATSSKELEAVPSADHSQTDIEKLSRIDYKIQPCSFARSKQHSTASSRPRSHSTKHYFISDANIDENSSEVIRPFTADSPSPSLVKRRTRARTLSFSPRELGNTTLQELASEVNENEDGCTSPELEQAPISSKSTPGFRNPFPYLEPSLLTRPTFLSTFTGINFSENIDHIDTDGDDESEDTLGPLVRKYNFDLYQNSGRKATKKDRSRQIMWEDSGYESPLLKTDGQGQETETGRKDSAATLISISQVTKQALNTTATTDPLLQKSSSHSKFNFSQRISKSVVATPITSSLNTYVVQQLNSLSLARTPSAQYSADQQSQGYQSYFSTGASEIGEMIPVFTSTPIKSKVLHRSGNTTTPPLLPSSNNQSTLIRPPTTMNPNTNTSSHSSGLGGTPVESYTFQEPHSSSATSINDNASFSSLLKDLDEDCNISKIIQESSDEFHGKYSQWIAQIFNLQLDKIQRRLQAQFDRKLESAVREKDREILTMQQKFRNKLIEFEASTEKFQKWIETLADENHRVRDTKDAIINEMQKTSEEQNEGFRLELEKQINNVQADCEKEKLVLQKKHADQLRSINDKSMGQVARLEEQFQNQIKSLQKLISELKGQNETLEDKLSFFRKTNEAQQSDIQSKYTNYHKEREQLLCHVNELREKVSETEKEKAALIAGHNSEILHAQSEAEQLIQTLSSRMTNSQSVAQEVVRKYEEDVHKMKQMMVTQEAQYKRTVDELKGKYGKKIEDLTKTVEGLQYELLGGNVKSSTLL